MDAPDQKEKELTRNTEFWKDIEAATVEFAAVGEEVGIWLTGRRWRSNNEGGTIVYRKVHSPCHAAAGGHWLWVTHQEHMVVGSELHKHLSRGDHNLVWFCYQHGPEMETAK
jgi:hypothetical protein